MFDVVHSLGQPKYKIKLFFSLRQADRWTERQMDRSTERKRDTKADIQKDRETERLKGVMGKTIRSKEHRERQRYKVTLG
jgi:hypothetical protein